MACEHLTDFVKHPGRATGWHGSRMLGNCYIFLVLLDVALVGRIVHAGLAPDQRPVGRARVARDVVLGVVEGLQVRYGADWDSVV